MIEATITLLPDAMTVQDMRMFAGEVQAFGIPEGTTLLGGGRAHPKGDKSRRLARKKTDIPTVADLVAWVASLDDLPSDAAIVKGDGIAVTAPRVVAEPSGCGEHFGKSPLNVYATINPACLDSRDCLG